MCGIALIISKNHPKPINKFLIQEINNRGPDLQTNYQIKVDDLYLEFFVSVLHLSGRQIGVQPVIRESKVFIWNGQIFNGKIPSFNNDISDTTLFSDFIMSANSREELVERMLNVDGPFSFIYFDGNGIYLGRDRFGRRSLLMINEDDRISISSIASSDGWNEVPIGISYIDIKQFRVFNYEIYPKFHINRNIPLILNSIDSFPVLNDLINSELDKTLDILSESVKIRTIGYKEKNIAILFSGGLDCSVLAAIAHKHIPINYSITLLNVAFENPRKLKTSRDGKVYEVPDRITGWNSYNSLCSLYPNREWIFVSIDIPYTEYIDKKDYIIKLMNPKNTVMDLSIVSALYFASRGKGTVNNIPFESNARILLSGLGADELLGGYSRHRGAFQNNNEDFTHLLNELQHDLDNISNRNLSRDDRIFSCHGKEARFPYLDYAFVKNIADLPIEWKCNLKISTPREIGEKLWLRLIANKLGLSSAKEVKRAIQFGARTAKLQTGFERGGDIIKNL